MTAFMIVQSRVTDAERFQRYRDAVTPLIASFGGRYMGGGEFDLLEGR